MRSLACALGLAAFIGVAEVPPVLAADDTWVSATGTDAGDCAIGAPCLSLRYALAQTSAGGSITVLSSGRYGPVNITKSVNIIAEGVEARITRGGPCGAAVCIKAGANDVVSLRGLTIQVDDYQKDGIAFLSGRSLQLDKCSVGGITRFGIFFNPDAPAELMIFDSKIGAMGEAIHLAPRSGMQRVILDRVQLHDSLHGLVFGSYGAAGSIRVMLRDSMIVNISGSGIIVDTGGGAVPNDLIVDRTVLANNSYGIDIRSGQNARIRMGDSIISGHSIASISPYGSIASYGTNKVAGNADYGADGAPLPTIPLK